LFLIDRRGLCDDIAGWLSVFISTGWN